MDRKRPFKYANVVATLALFFALGGGAAIAANQLGKNAVKTGNIAPKAVKTKQIAPKAVKTKQIAPNAVKAKQIANNAVTASKVKASSLDRSKLVAGTLSGLPVLDVSAASVPGLTTYNPNDAGTPVPLTGTATFTPVAGKSYVLLASMQGTPVDGDGADPDMYGGNSCYAYVDILSNGNVVTGMQISANANQEAPYNVQPSDGASDSIGMIDTTAQTITATSYGDQGCGPATTAAIRVTVVELG